LFFVQAAKSEVFLKKMKALDQLKNVTLEVHVMPEVLEPFVHYFYSGHISHRDLKNHASKVLTAAKRYAVPSLQLIAEQYIAKHVTRDTALSVWELGVDHSSDTIKDAVLTILLHTKDLQDVLKLSEYHMFRAQKDPELLVGLFEQRVGRIT
jgi:hypothetical protein